MAAHEIHGRCNFVQLFSPSFPHILEKIFFSLDYQSYKNCLEVNSEWKGVLTSERYKKKGRSVFEREIVEDEWKLQEAAEMDRREEVSMLLASGMVDVNCEDTVQRHRSRDPRDRNPWDPRDPGDPWNPLDPWIPWDSI